MNHKRTAGVGSRGVFDLAAFRAKVETSDVMSVQELADYLSLGINTTYQYLRDGTIPGTRVGRRWIVSRRRIATWLDSANVPASGTAAGGRV